MSTRVTTVRSADQAADAAAQGAKVIREGGLVGFATETVYGIAALATDVAAMDRLRDLKPRPARPFSLHVGRPADVARYVRNIPAPARLLMGKVWPGPVTVVLPAEAQLADPLLRQPGLYERLVHEGAIGIRCPDEPVAAAMLAAVDGPVVAPSANLAGRPSPRTAQDVLDQIDGQLDLLIDSGKTRYGVDSTIVAFGVDGEPDKWRIVREGVLDHRMISTLARRVVLFVCTGNTCRSPLAEGLAKAMLARRAGCRVAELPEHGVEVFSAGVAGGEGAPASPEAARAARELGADITAHRSRALTPELIQAADVVFCMTDFHAAQASRLLPQAVSKVQRLSPRGEIPDPIGGGEDVYRRTAEAIEEALRSRMDEGLL